MSLPTSPTFNGNKIFDSLNPSGATPASFLQGKLFVHGYSTITQPIHFEGENGDWTLVHGYPDQDWTFDGLISATTLADFNTAIKAIQSAIDDGLAGHYRVLIDPLGNYYDNAQVRTYTPLDAPHIRAEGGYVVPVRITGIVQGTAQVGGTT